MTFEEWWEEHGGGDQNDYVKVMAEAAWNSAKQDISQRLRFHDMYTIYSDAYTATEWDEIGTTPEDEITEIIGD